MSCCGTNPCGSSTDRNVVVDKTERLASVQNYYGKVLSSSKDLKTNACTASGRPPQYILDVLAKVPAEVLDRFFGCSNPIPTEIEGLTVLDLGSGSGRDCYLAAKLVGPTGRVIGVDMTDEQLAVALKHAETFCRDALGYPQNILEFRKGLIEDLGAAGISSGSVDVVVSNCVVNLCPDKEAVLREAARVLREGGELYFGDMYCDRRLNPEHKKDDVLWGEGIAGALYIEDFLRIARRVGFTDPRVLKKRPIVVKDTALLETVGEAKFFAITYRCFKLSSLETKCEDYGQVAIYKGGILGSTHGYDLDDHHHFTKGKPMLVCGNTAAMLQETRLGKFFQVQGDRSVHYGLFPCGPVPNDMESSSGTAAGGGSCSAGSCC
eukprot:RCo011250